MAGSSLPGPASADDPEPASSTPLLDFALEQPPPAPSFVDSLNKRLAGITAEMQRHPPPEGEDCAQTLGANRFADQYISLATIRSSLGDFDGAITALESALECTPRDASVHGALASEQLRAGKLGEARATLERGMTIDRDDETIDSTMSQLDFIEEHWASATARLRARATIEMDPERATYSQCLLWLAQRRAGVQAPELASRDSYDLWPTQILDVLQGRLTEAELVEAIKEREAAPRRREQLAQALYYVGQLQLANGQTELARRYFAAAVDLEVPHLVEHPMALAELEKLRDTGQPMPD